MCGVIGFRSKNVTDEDLNLVRNLFKETVIRGRHATGVTCFQGNQLHTIKLPIPADEFINEFDPARWVDLDGSLTFIAHTRYSTSDLEYNQPISDETLSIVHNGIISQELPDNWKDLYGFECEGKNDSELLFRSIKAGNTPDYWESASISTIYLTDKGELSYYRNGKRPLWVFEDERSLILTSTKDIANRCGILGVNKVEFVGTDIQP